MNETEYREAREWVRTLERVGEFEQAQAIRTLILAFYERKK